MEAHMSLGRVVLVLFWSVLGGLLVGIILNAYGAEAWANLRLLLDALVERASNLVRLQAAAYAQENDFAFQVTRDETADALAWQSYT
jgi:hypothetical protein